MHILLWAHQFRIWEHWVPGTGMLSGHTVMQAKIGLLGKSQRWWTELCSLCDLPIHTVWARSWANINTWCCFGFCGYFYIVNIKPWGLFSGLEANWPSLACLSRAKVILTEKSDCIQSTTGKLFLLQAHAWVLSRRVFGYRHVTLLRF